MRNSALHSSVNCKTNHTLHCSWYPFHFTVGQWVNVTIQRTVHGTIIVQYNVNMTWRGVFLNEWTHSTNHKYACVQCNVECSIMYILQCFIQYSMMNNIVSSTIYKRQGRMSFSRNMSATPANWKYVYSIMDSSLCSTVNSVAHSKVFRKEQYS